MESNLVKEALADGGESGFVNAGRCVQMGIVMQVLVGVPVLLIWAFVMDDVVMWLVSDQNIASIAGDYAKVIIIDYILRGTTRALMLPFHLSGQAHFERNIDVLAALLTLIAIVVVASKAQAPGEPSLYYIGWIQVIVGVARTVIKIGHVTVRGWLQPYRNGLVGSLVLTVSVSYPAFPVTESLCSHTFHSLCSLREPYLQQNPAALCSFFLQVVPLFLGSLLEPRRGTWTRLFSLLKRRLAVKRTF